MTSNFPACCAGFTLRPENDGQPFHITPGDTGGATSWGVTIGTWSRWIGRQATICEMRALTVDDVLPVYEALYWKPVHEDQLPAGVDLMVFDHSVLCGEHESAIELQFTVKTQQDAYIGALTLAAMRQMEPMDLIYRLARVQEAHFRIISTFPRFGAGWLARLDRRVKASVAMLEASSTPQS